MSIANLSSRSESTSGQGPADMSSKLCSFTRPSHFLGDVIRPSTRPVRSCRITTPNAYTSDSVYPIVPFGFVRRMMVSSSRGFTCTIRAVPKPPSRLASPSSRRTLVSFRSAWMMALGRSARILTRSSHGSPLESLSRSVPLGRYSYTRVQDS
ncbi:hypothetical protein BDA96_06G034700 [Sorghum bicolor]|uniref:Uncharacterized protein n=1 Tax=Sorghum bicolor TaxID=4558 RepID=A0A921QN70_SORBI|nr:hypothetical protein BDA96_06G034700 [Sorghum bicolor]